MTRISRSLGILLVAGLVYADGVVAEQPIAFPGAEGFGANAKGGRGGDVYHVTTLSDDGDGSLRRGIENMSGPRTIVFEVSGTIYLESPLNISKSHLTIAGQTAPGDGITLAHYPLWISADHVVLRYIRSRLGDAIPQQSDAVSLRSGHNIIVDHVSASWSTDEVMSAQSSELDLVTIQWCLVAEGLNQSHHPKGAHGYGGILGALRLSAHHNLFANLKSRAPKVSGRRHTETDFRNNVIYNWQINNNYDGAASYINWANNYYKSGPATRNGVKYQVFDLSRHYVSPLGQTEDPDHETALYADGNFVVGSAKVSADNWNGGISFSHGATESEHRSRTPHDFPAIESETTAKEAYPLVLAAAGTSLVRDAVDARIISEVMTGSATYGDGVIDSQSEVGGYPELRSGPAPADRDRDGMADDWEIANGLDPDDSSDRNETTLSATYYTNLEVYLNGLIDSKAGESEPVILGYGKDIFSLGPLLYEDPLNDANRFVADWVVQMSAKDPEVERYARIEDGRLHVRDPRGSTIWYKTRLSGPVMITYRVSVPSAQNDSNDFMVRDLNNFWLATSPTGADDLFDNSRYTGDFSSYRDIHSYYASTGGGRNTTTRMRLYPRQVEGEAVPHPVWNALDGQENFLLEPDREILVQLVAYKDIVQYYNNGRLFYEVKRGDPVTTLTDGTEHSNTAAWGKGEFMPLTDGYFGFRTTHSHHVIRDFKVYRLIPR